MLMWLSFLATLDLSSAISPSGQGILALSAEGLQLFDVDVNVDVAVLLGDVGPQLGLQSDSSSPPEYLVQWVLSWRAFMRFVRS